MRDLERRAAEHRSAADTADAKRIECRGLDEAYTRAQESYARPRGE
jgi:hypothetical protein